MRHVVRVGLTIRRRVINRFETSETFAENDFFFVFVHFTTLLPARIPLRSINSIALRSGRSVGRDYEFLERYPKKKNTFSLRRPRDHECQMSLKRYD